MCDKYYAIRWRSEDPDDGGYIGSLDRGIIHYPCQSLAQAHIRMIIRSGGSALYEVVEFDVGAGTELAVNTTNARTHD